MASGPGHRRNTALETARTRLLVGGAVFGVCFMTVGLRLADLSVIHSADDVRAGGGREIAGPIEVPRADIVDRNGVLLATSLSTASLYADPKRVLDASDAAQRLAPMLPETSAAELEEKLSSERGFVWLKRNLTPKQQFEVNRLGIPGLDFTSEERRVYPHGNLAAHVVGFTGVDNEGLGGIEQSFDHRLSSDAQPLRLSLDIRVQQILRQELSAQIDKFNAIGGGGVVLDVNTGEVMALVSLPDFDPNDAGDADSDSRFNRISLGVYELGSVFKIFNHAMALDSGATTMSGGYDASKPIRVARFTINDFHPENRWLSVPEIFMYSSNIGSAKMALDVGGPAQRQFLSELGLLQPVGLELPEQGKPIYPARWREINTMTIAYGHGIAISPMGLSSAVAAVVNGGTLHAATLLKRAANTTAAGTRVISTATSDAMRRLLRLVVENGTGRNAEAPGYLVGGKTGTAEKQVGGRYKRNALISSFVGVFPINSPRYVVVAMLDEPKGIKESFGFATGGWTAAPVVGQVIERAAPLLGIAPVDEDEPDKERKLLLTGNTRDQKVAAY